MIFYISFFVFLWGLMSGVLGVISGQISAAISLLGLILLLVCTFSKSKYKERELAFVCELLPIINDVYAIKTVKNKYLYKYIDA